MSADYYGLLYVTRGINVGIWTNQKAEGFGPQGRLRRRGELQIAGIGRVDVPVVQN